MRFKRLLHHLRLIVIVTIGVALGCVVGGIYYFNQSGANAQWRNAIASEMEKRGFYADFESLKFDPTRGLVARGVTVYQDESREDVVAELEHLVIDVDKTKIMRGVLQVDEVSLKDAHVSLPLDPSDPSSPIIVVEKLQGSIALPNQKTFEAREVSGFVEGIKIVIKDSRIWSEHIGAAKQPKPIQETRVSRIKMIARVLQEIHQWRWPAKTPPVLTLSLVGNVDNPDAARLDFQLEAEELERKGVTLRKVLLTGGYSNKYLTIEKFSLEEGAGSILAKADFHPQTRRVRFDATSSLHLQSLARRLFEQDLLTEVTFSKPPTIECEGEVVFDENFIPQLSAIGRCDVSHFSLLGSDFTSMASEFSVQGSDLFLTGLKAKHRQGELAGKLLIKGETIRFKVDSSLPIHAFRPFLEGSGIQRTLDQAVFNPKSRCVVSTEGTMNRSDLTQWSASGAVAFENVIFREVGLHKLSGKYDLSNLHMNFSDIEAVFDYSNYSLRKRYGGPSSGRATVQSIKINPAANRVSINNIRATAWPAPIVRLFVKGTANHVEQYRFTRPPVLRASGNFDLRRGANLTDFTVNLSSSASTYYDFLGKPLNLKRIKAKVRITSSRVDVTGLSFNTFQGPCAGNISVNIAKAPSSYRGNMKWNRLHLRDIGKLYGFSDAERGLITGGTSFSGVGDRVSSIYGKGSVSLEKGNLFSVPMLGPVTPLLGVVLGKKYSVKERAKDASCKFSINRGVIYTNDFLATTRSLKFTGDGTINLNNKRIDLTMRMNARGLLGVFALPLRPFMGLFQFKGAGPVTAPKWRTTMFTSPKRGKNDPIFNKPSRARVVPE